MKEYPKFHTPLINTFILTHIKYLKSIQLFNIAQCDMYNLSG